VPRHIARLVTRLVAPLVVDFSASRRLVIDFSASRRLVVDFSASRRLVVDYFAYAARLGASARRASHRSSSIISPPSRVRMPRHIVRLVTRLVAPLVVDFSASRRLVVKYFTSAARPGASARRAARHAARCAARCQLLRVA
jgi:hypothetical protein